MPFVFIYILKLSVSLAVVFLFYHFALRKLTFYNWNRWYLLGYTLLSFFIPFIDISPVLQRNEWSGNSIVQWVPVINQSNGGIAESSAVPAFTTWHLVSLLIVAGMLFMLVRLLVQLISFRRLVRKADPVAVGLLPGSNMKLYQVNENIIPFSFGNSIFINHRLHTTAELREIIWHEFIHVKQNHSLDIICGELLCLLNWYNPFAWLLRRSIRQNLEFIADSKVLESGINRKEYQYLLLKVIGNNHFSIAPKFNFSSLKKRIAMMNKMKSAGLHIVKFLFILPLVAVLLVAFRNNNREPQPLKNPLTPGGKEVNPSLKLSVFTDTVPAITTPNSKGYFIDIIGVNGECVVVVKDKNGKEAERLLLTEWNVKAEKYEQLYGELLLPPAPPAVPAAPTSPTPPTEPLPPTPPSPAQGANPACPVYVTGTVAPVAWINAEGINLAGISREYEITDKQAIIKLMDGTLEKYDLTNKTERSAFEKKYGKIINVSTAVRTNVNANVNANVAANVNANVRTNVNANVNANVNTTVRPVITPVPAESTLITAVSPGASMGSNGTTVITPVAVARRIAGTSMASASPRPASLTDVPDDYGYVINGKEDIVISITKKTTRQELENFKAQMKEKGVDLSFDDIEYNEKGFLVSLNGTMRSGDSQSNFVATDFNKLILAMIKKGDRTYFKVSTKDNKEVI